MWNLANKENWELILSENRSVVYKNGTLPTSGDYKYTPISPIYATPNSHALLIGTYSKSARVHWFLGATVSQYLYVSPSTNTNLISGVQTPEIKKVGLNQLTLVRFLNYGILPYVLQLKIPYWLEDIYIEVWEYKENFSTEEIEELEKVKQQLYDVEDKLDQLLNK